MNNGLTKGSEQKISKPETFAVINWVVAAEIRNWPIIISATII